MIPCIFVLLSSSRKGHVGRSKYIFTTHQESMELDIVSSSSPSLLLQLDVEGEDWYIYSALSLKVSYFGGFTFLSLG